MRVVFHIVFTIDRGLTVCLLSHRLCDAIIVVLKYLEAPMDPTAPSQRISSIRGIRSNLQKQYEVDLKARSNTEALSASNRWASWPQILDAARWLCDDFRSLLKVYRREQAGKDSAWSPAMLGAGGDLVPLSRRVAAAAQDALCVLLYTVIPPARGLEYSTLQWSKCLQI